jgi:hypothetical protein
VVDFILGRLIIYGNSLIIITVENVNTHEIKGHGIQKGHKTFETRAETT